MIPGGLNVTFYGEEWDEGGWGKAALPVNSFTASCYDVSVIGLEAYSIRCPNPETCWVPKVCVPLYRISFSDCLSSLVLLLHIVVCQGVPVFFSF